MGPDDFVLMPFESHYGGRKLYPLPVYGGPETVENEGHKMLTTADLDKTAKALRRIDPARVTGNVSRRAARRRVDHFLSAYDAFCGAYAAEFKKPAPYHLQIVYRDELAQIAALEAVSRRKDAETENEPMISENETIRMFELFWRAYRRAKRAIGRYTRPTEIQARLAAYRTAWESEDRAHNFPLLFRSPRTRAVAEYLMALIDIAQSGRICQINDDFYTAFDETFDAEEAGK